LFASAGWDGFINIRAAEQDKVISAIKGGLPWAPLTIAFTPDGRRLATAAAHSRTKDVRVWETSSGLDLLSMRSHTAPMCVCFSPDGTTLASGGEDGTITFWLTRPRRCAPGAETGQSKDDPELTSLSRTAQELNDLAWQLATSPDSTVRDGPKALALAKKAVTLTDGKDPLILDTLAAAYAETGDFSNAVAKQNDALVLLKHELTKKDYESRLKLYESNMPYRQHE
jgi:WD40 repeat protein